MNEASWNINRATGSDCNFFFASLNYYLAFENIKCMSSDSMSVGWWSRKARR